MKKIGVLRNTLGLAFIIFGIIWSIWNRYSCLKICSKCQYDQISPCFFLFLFVGIIFIVCGASLILTEKERILGKKKEKKI